MTKTCAGCQLEIPLDPALWKTRTARSGVGLYFVYCKPCHARKSRETYARQVSTPEGRALAREQRRRWRESQLERDPAGFRARLAAKQRETYIRHHDRIKAECRARYQAKVSTLAGRMAVNEAARISARLRAEREGREIRAFPVKNPLTGVRVSVHYLNQLADKTLPVEPLQHWVEQNDLNTHALGSLVHKRYGRAVKAGRPIRLGDADALITRAGYLLHDVYPDDEYPELYA